MKGSVRGEEAWEGKGGIGERRVEGKGKGKRVREEEGVGIWGLGKEEGYRVTEMACCKSSSVASIRWLLGRLHAINGDQKVDCSMDTNRQTYAKVLEMCSAEKCPTIYIS